MMKHLGYSFFLMLFFSSCSVEPVAINYGQDACDFCQMNIVDEQHAAELVTSKGKAYKYDAIECMMNYLNRKELKSDDMSFLLITNYNEPGKLIDAKSATYIHSEAIPSPMGGFLSAVYDKDVAEQIVDAKGGETLDWEELKTRYEVE